MIGMCTPSISFAKGKLAVMDLKAGHRIDKGLAEAFSVGIRDKIHGFGDYEVLTKEDMGTLAEKANVRKSLDCQDTKCLIDFGRAIGTRHVVVGSISKLGSTYYVDLRLIDTVGEDAGVKRKINKDCFCTVEELFDTSETVAALIMGKIQLQAAQAAPTGKKKALPKKITNGLGMQFVLIPAGTFAMGSPPDEPGRANDEKEHGVTISTPFYLQTTEVTQRQWKQLMEENPSRFKFDNCGDDCPVETVSWQEAQEFIKRLNEKEKTDQYRLPTEAEWEFACRAGTATPFNTGNCITTDRANYNGENPFKHSLADCPKGVNRKSTVRAGSFPPNAWGLHDMHGNVWEWCQDWEDGYPAGHVIDPKGPSSGKDRVLRGGSWLDEARNLRSARRFKSSPYYRDADFGFRLAKDS
jgi:formylglycine-generating enzyme required for sulfatase activity